MNNLKILKLLNWLFQIIRRVFFPKIRLFRVSPHRCQRGARVSLGGLGQLWLSQPPPPGASTVISEELGRGGLWGTGGQTGLMGHITLLQGSRGSSGSLIWSGWLYKQVFSQDPVVVWESATECQFFAGRSENGQNPESLSSDRVNSAVLGQ